MIPALSTLLLLTLSSAPAALPQQEVEPAFEPLFDGKTLEGWSFREQEAKWWRVEDGAITGGSLVEEVPHNTFLTTVENFQDFELELSIKIEDRGGFANSGIQIRTVRHDSGPEVYGFQVDVGDGYWGLLYDEYRRGMIQAAERREEVVASIEPGGWQHYRILAEGRRLRSWINGIPSTDYTEVLPDIPLDGIIALQVHGGGKVQIQVKDIRIKRLPPSPHAMTWEGLRRREATPPEQRDPWHTPEQEKALFTLAEGFEIELVASEEHVQKIVDIAFDDQGRMWGLTAAEYPIDANEDPRAASKYQGGGKDQVVVWDDIWNHPRQAPRVFVDGLAMPMAILPQGDSILLGHGPEVLRLTDEDGDGKADSREVLLDGFGIDDSHLMPHRFVRAPAGWVYLAQGAFNFSEVRAKDGSVTTFNRCKVARFRPDGSAFETVGIGFNNIWGFVLGRGGDMWIQEANDLGYPLVPFLHGASYPGTGMERFLPSSPWRAPTSDVVMGGTGLSGLARSEDRNGFPPPWNERFLVANPIVNLIQSLEPLPDGHPDDWRIRKTEDLIVSADRRFRPVAIHFGPDGCLYIVDWYNPIISHNEVPRDHPDRDKASTRIWRVRHASQSTERPLDVTQVVTAELPALLDHANTLTARAAWHQLVARGDEAALEQVAVLAMDPATPSETRILACWTLEDRGTHTPAMVAGLLKEEDLTLQREGARLAATLALDGPSLTELLASTFASTDPQVRRHAIASLAQWRQGDDRLVMPLLNFLRAPVEGESVVAEQGQVRAFRGLAGEIAFERDLLKVALQERRPQLQAWTSTTEFQALPRETRIFAAMCLDGPEGAAVLAALSHGLQRRPFDEELEFLAEHVDQSSVSDLLLAWLDDPKMRLAALRTLSLTHDPDLPATLRTGVAWTLAAFAEADPQEPQRDLMLQTAKALRIPSFGGTILAWMEAGLLPPQEALAALVAVGLDDPQVFHDLAQAQLPGSDARRSAVRGLASLDTPQAHASLLSLWPKLENPARKAAVGEMVATRSGSVRLLDALEAGSIQGNTLDGLAWTRMEEHLGDDRRLRSQREKAAEGVLPCLRNPGGDGDYAPADLTIDGPFTVETWVYLEPGITNADGILGLPQGFDINFHDRRARIWNGQSDIIILDFPCPERTWFHLALSRDQAGNLRMYFNGELVVTTQGALRQKLEGLAIARSNASGNLNGRLAEFRLWDVARSEEELHAGYRRSLQEADEIEGLQYSSTLHAPPLVGDAVLEPAFDLPRLWTREEAAAEAARFARYRALAKAPGDVGRGREVFDRLCLACHAMAGRGGAIGPVLDGSGAKGTEGLLRAILTPNAGVESGYRNLLVRTKDGRVLVGFLAEEAEASITLRRVGMDDLVLPRSEIESLGFQELSLMPEGLLESLPDQEVSDLFRYMEGQ